MYLVLYSFRVTVFITLQIYVTLVILPNEIGNIFKWYYQYLPSKT